MIQTTTGSAVSVSPTSEPAQKGKTKGAAAAKKDAAAKKSDRTTEQDDIKQDDIIGQCIYLTAS